MYSAHKQGVTSICQFLDLAPYFKYQKYASPLDRDCWICVVENKRLSHAYIIQLFYRACNGADC